MSETMKGAIQGIHHIAIRVYDFDKTVQFYTEILGFTRRYGWGDEKRRIVLLDTGDGNYLEVFSDGTEARKPEGTIIHFAFRTEDVDGVIERVRAAGAQITVEPINVLIQGDPPTEVRLAFFLGLDGESIELFQSIGNNKL